MAGMQTGLCTHTGMPQHQVHYVSLGTLLPAEQQVVTSTRHQHAAFTGHSLCPLASMPSGRAEYDCDCGGVVWGL